MDFPHEDSTMSMKNNAGLNESMNERSEDHLIDNGIDIDDDDCVHQYSTSVFNGDTIHQWQQQDREIAQWCLEGLYAGTDIAEYVTIVDMDDAFDTVTAAKEYLGNWYSPELWIEPPHSEHNIQWRNEYTIEATQNNFVTDDDVVAMPVLCKAWCEWYDDFACTASISALFIKETSEIKFTDEPYIFIEEADNAV